MKSIAHLLVAMFIAAAASNALAARPTSLKFAGKGELEGKQFVSYTVKCSNGKVEELTAWERRRKWCVGNTASESCHRKQMRAAKAACKAS